MLNQQPKDVAGYINNTSMLANIIGNKIIIEKDTGIFFGISIAGTSTNLIGTVVIEGAAESSTGLEADLIWCPLSSDTITNTIFSSTNSSKCPFDLTFTQAKYIRLNYTFTSGTGTAVMKCDCYLKPL